MELLKKYGPTALIVLAGLKFYHDGTLGFTGLFDEPATPKGTSK
jgi:hypothetical protein